MGSHEQRNFQQFLTNDQSKNKVIDSTQRQPKLLYDKIAETAYSLHQEPQFLTPEAQLVNFQRQTGGIFSQDASLPEIYSQGEQSATTSSNPENYDAQLTSNVIQSDLHAHGYDPTLFQMDEVQNLFSPWTTDTIPNTDTLSILQSNDTSSGQVLLPWTTDGVSCNWNLNDATITAPMDLSSMSLMKVDGSVESMIPNDTRTLWVSQNGSTICLVHEDLSLRLVDLQSLVEISSVYNPHSTVEFDFDSENPLDQLPENMHNLVDCAQLQSPNQQKTQHSHSTDSADLAPSTPRRKYRRRTYHPITDLEKNQAVNRVNSMGETYNLSLQKRTSIAVWLERGKLIREYARVAKQTNMDTEVNRGAIAQAGKNIVPDCLPQTFSKDEANFAKAYSKKFQSTIPGVMEDVKNAIGRRTSRIENIETSTAYEQNSTLDNSLMSGQYQTQLDLQQPVKTANKMSVQISNDSASEENTPWNALIDKYKSIYKTEESSTIKGSMIIDATEQFINKISLAGFTHKTLCEEFQRCLNARLTGKLNELLRFHAKKTFKKNTKQHFST